MNEYTKHDVLALSDLAIRLTKEVTQLRDALKFYADPQNTVRDCMAGGGCANADLCRLAQDTLGLDEYGKEK